MSATIDFDMHPDRIAELLEPYLQDADDRRPFSAGPARSERTDDALIHYISTYIDLLLHWNARINLTAIRDPEEIVTRHFGESLFAARRLFPKVYPVSSVPALSEAEGSPALKDLDFDFANDQRLTTNDRVADVGSGAGFPGIPIKLWAPQVSLTLIEATQKKATCLREVARALTLTDINIQNARAETLPPATFNVVTFRAVERFANALPVAANLVVPSGRLALLISSPQREAARSTLRHLTWDSPIAIPQSRSRELLVGTIEPGE
jgi:16S rRNA (guanine527-N7)-methyltransferase